jgi:hypothetical protein
MLFDHKPATGPQEDLANLNVSEARVGDAISISGAAPDFSDLDFTVDRRDICEAGSRRWIELSGTWRDQRIYLEIHNEDAIQILGSFDGRSITLDELGLSEEDLGQMDQRQNPSDFFDYDGKFWLYRFSREIGLFTWGATTGRGFYCWQFQEQDSKRFMSIRKFEGEPFNATIWKQLDPADVTIYRSA